MAAATQKVSLFGVILVHTFPHWDWIWRSTLHLSALSPYGENADQNNSEYGHFLHSVSSTVKQALKNFSLNSCMLVVLPALEIETLVFVGKILWRFKHKIA